MTQEIGFKISKEIPIQVVHRKRATLFLAVENSPHSAFGHRPHKWIDRIHHRRRYINMSITPQENVVDGTYLKEYALATHRAGFNVIPMRSDSKAPALPTWKEYTKREKQAQAKKAHHSRLFPSFPAFFPSSTRLFPVFNPSSCATVTARNGGTAA